MLFSLKYSAVRFVHDAFLLNASAPFTPILFGDKSSIIKFGHVVLRLRIVKAGTEESNDISRDLEKINIDFYSSVPVNL